MSSLDHLRKVLGHKGATSYQRTTRRTSLSGEVRYRTAQVRTLGTEGFRAYFFSGGSSTSAALYLAEK